MSRSRINGNFIDKTFSIVANILLRIIPTLQEKRGIYYYRDAQSEGNYAEALQNYYEAMRLEIDPYDRSYILYNIGLIHTSNGEHTKALEYYFERSNETHSYHKLLIIWPKLSSTVLREGINHLFRPGRTGHSPGDSEIAEAWFDQAAEYWKQAIALTPGNYIEAHNWLKITRRFE
uniref:Putative photosystem I assembly protein Ycf3 n=1 Tax=Helianthus annuus TaxID=4232 RepID=A0A251UVK9_HELAN